MNRLFADSALDRQQQTTGGVETLREMLDAPGLIRLMGAHNAIGARMAIKAGFDGIWSSGFELSTSFGIPDASLVTMTEQLAVVQAMRHCESAPIVVDCDTGYGDAFNCAYMTRRFEAAGASAVCIEDKRFPKRNSFMEAPHQLLSASSFADKIAAACAARRSDDLLVVARTEALVSGLGAAEALRRATLYAEAGADAVLVHSKAHTVEPLAEVLRSWDQRVPIVAVPTTYPDVTADQLAELGVKIVIYANQGIRSALRAMEETHSEILRCGTSAHLEPNLLSLRSIFELQGAGALESWRGTAQPAATESGDEPEDIAPAPTPRASSSGDAPRLPGELLGRLLCDGIDELPGTDFHTGLPDSTTKSLFHYLESAKGQSYVPAVSEEAAIGLAAGAFLGGCRKPMVVMQNSGLGTAVTALASLIRLYEIPLLLVVGWRGDDGRDSPEHHLMGRLTLDLLRGLGIPFVVLSDHHPTRDVRQVLEWQERGLTSSLVVRPGSLA